MARIAHAGGSWAALVRQPFVLWHVQGRVLGPHDVQYHSSILIGQGRPASHRVRARGISHGAQCIGRSTPEGDGSGPAARACDSWLCKMGDPVKQSDNTCAISACIMCMEALHRIAYEKINGPGTFGLKVKPGTDEELKLKLKLKAIGPAAYVEEVLDAIDSIEGLPTTDDDYDVRLTFKGYDARYCTVVARDAAAMIAQGPVVGGMCYGNSKEAYGKLCEEGNTYLGPKVDDEPIPHAVVCVGYKFEHGAGLHIQILDNHEAEGPVRWVHYNAFHLFTVITVDAINSTAVLPTL